MALTPTRRHGGERGTGLERSASSAVTPAERGAALFLAKGCATCHDGPTSTAAVSVGPDLGELPNVAADPRAKAWTPRPTCASRSARPQAFVVAGYTTVLMPTLPVDDQELDALVRYLLG